MLKITEEDGTEKGADAKASLGDTITYQVTVKNTGNVDLINVAIKDFLPGIVVPEGAFEIGKLEAGASETVEYTYVVKESDLGKEIVNTAAAEGDVSDDPKDKELLRMMIQ